LKEADCVIIVEGKTDKERLQQVLAEPVAILCTYGSYSAEKAERLARLTEEAEEVYLFMDQDESGKKLRRQLQEEIPHVLHLYTQKLYGEVARTPLDVLADILERAGFTVRRG
jgi:toprim domain protein